jgi:UDP-glucose 4-epimerase
MNIFITGGAGFIGSHLSECLLRDGHRVAILDDLSTGSFRNIEHLKKNPGFSYTIDSVFNAPLVAELVDSADMVYHLAAAVGVRLIVESPVRTIETNVHGTEVVLRAAAKKKKPLLITSTSEVYGKSVNIPFREDADLVMGATTRGRWSYACSKALDEFLGLAYWTEKSVPVTVVRLFNTVGPRQTGQYGMVVPTLIRQALTDAPMTIYGTGEQSRCFASVLDVAAILAKIATAANVAGEVINVGNDQEISINQLAAKIKDITGSSSDIVHIPYDVAYGPGFEDMFRRVPCLDKVQRLLGQRPTATIDTIIEQVVSAIRSELPVVASA